MFIMSKTGWVGRPRCSLALIIMSHYQMPAGQRCDRHDVAVGCRVQVGAADRHDVAVVYRVEMGAAVGGRRCGVWRPRGRCRAETMSVVHEGGAPGGDSSASESGFAVLGLSLAMAVALPSVTTPIVFVCGLWSAHA